MRTLIAFFIRHHVFFMFMLMEITAMGMLVQSHYYQSSRLANSSAVWSGQLLEGTNNATEYFSLKKVNTLLAEENARLKNLKRVQSILPRPNQQYQYISAKVIKNSYNKRSNYLTLNKGSLHGLESGMGVCNSSGVIGIIREVSTHYATVMSVLNKNTVISTRFRKSNHFGELHWDGKSADFAQLQSIEKYAPISVGDSLITNSYSSIFPEGIPIGTINRFERLPSENFYNIEVDLSVDYSNIDYVYIIKNLHKTERQTLEKNQIE